MSPCASRISAARTYKRSSSPARRMASSNCSIALRWCPWCQSASAKWRRASGSTPQVCTAWPKSVSAVAQSSRSSALMPRCDNWRQLANERGTGPSRLGKWQPQVSRAASAMNPQHACNGTTGRLPPAAHRRNAVAGIVAMGLGQGTGRGICPARGRTNSPADRGGRPTWTKSGGMLMNVGFFRKLLLTEELRQNPLPQHLASEEEFATIPADRRSNRIVMWESPRSANLSNSLQNRLLIEIHRRHFTSASFARC